MIGRRSARALLAAAKTFPIVAVTGPRQSGKTTLCRAIFDDRPYLTFEDPETRHRFEGDPRGFLARYNDGAVFDEAQKCPDLFSYIQGLVDGDARMGRFVLTGSSQFHLFSGITQSLAGRVVTLELLPFSYGELQDDGRFVNPRPELDELLLRGFFPPIYDRGASPRLWYANYVNNYIERDVRALLNVRDLGVFQRFMRLCAARAGQLLNLSEIGNEAGINHNTTKAWMSVLEASYIVFLLQPFHTNYSKRLVKTPKLYFYDPGLLCWLLSISTAEMLNLSPMRGAIFESYIVGELTKQRYNALESRNFYFWRDRSGNEIDLIVDHGLGSTPVEIKSAKTFQPKFLKQVQRWQKTSGSNRPPALIFGGDEPFEHQGCRVIPWHAAKVPD